MLFLFFALKNREDYSSSLYFSNFVLTNKILISTLAETKPPEEQKKYLNKKKKKYEL